MRSGQLPQANCRACKYALNTLMNIFGSPALPGGLTPETLAGLVRVLLMRLVDDNLGRQPEGEALLKVRIKAHVRTADMHGELQPLTRCKGTIASSQGCNTRQLCASARHNTPTMPSYVRLAIG